MFVAAVYLLCACTSLACTALLVRAWRQSGSRLLFWSSLCFAVLSVNNILLVADKLVLPQVDLTTARLLTELIALVLLLFGLVWEEQ
ncbi:MAG TPA: DUF5985 family protein [Ramlibacter sp.]|nr:DUF5985 family protein [Ramlibacter sp.]